MHVIEVGAKLLLGNFEDVFKKTKHIVPIVIYKCKIYKNQEHYEQVGYIALWKAFNEYDGDSLDVFQKKAYTYAKHSILNELRKMKRIEERIVPFENRQFALFTKEEMHSSNHVSEILEDLYSTLTSEELQIIELIYLQGYTYNEVAQILNITPHALKKKRDRLLKRLRTQRHRTNHKENVS